MENHRVESVRVGGRFGQVFEYIANPHNLPAWTHAFKAVCDGKAILATPDGTVEIGLRVDSSRPTGTIDWHMAMPDGTNASAFSRVVQESDRHCVFTFILMAPPMPLEKLEGTLDQQAAILRAELVKLKEILAAIPANV